jgi:hypothetical protein
VTAPNLTDQLPTRRLIPAFLRRWAERLILRAVSGIEAWETAHDWDEEEASEA